MKRFFRELRRINWPQTLFGSLRRTVVSLILFIPIVVYAVSFGYQYYLQQNPAIVYAHKLKTLTAQVNKTIPLPSNETPVVATVTDTTILPKEAFFNNAKNGDKILMYKKNRLAVLYRPSTDKVITKAVLEFRDVTPTPIQHQAVAGASTSAAGLTVSQVSPTVLPPQSQQSSGTNTYYPDGKILVQPHK